MNIRNSLIAIASVLSLSVITSAALAQDSVARASTDPVKSEESQSGKAKSGRHSWFSDQRNFQVGDIVTVLVDEYTLTSLDKRVDATDNRRRDLGASVSTPGSGQSFAIGTVNNATSQSRGTDARANRVATEMSARVVEVGPNGLVRLEGTKTLNVEKSKISLALSGWARTQDISSNNFVASSRLADARLDYQAEGPLGSPKGGILGRILGKLWP